MRLAEPSSSSALSHGGVVAGDEEADAQDVAQGL
jgi:hypothetical protein